MDPREIFLPRPDVSDINGRGVEFIRSKLPEFCSETVDLVYNGVGAYLEADRDFEEELKRKLAGLFADKVVDEDADPDTEIVRPVLPKGEVLGTFVQQDTYITGPNGSFDEPIRTFFTRVEPREEEGDDLETDPDGDIMVDEVELIKEAFRPKDERYMLLHVPVGDRVIDDYEMPELKEVAEVFVQTVDGDDVRWYAIQRSGSIHEYIPETEKTDTRVAAVDRRMWADFMNEGVPEAQDTILEVLNHVIKWKTVPQAYRTIK